MIVFETDFPVFDFTVTVTLQDPALIPLRDARKTLQYFAEDDDTLIETTDPLFTGNVKNDAMDFAESDVRREIAGASNNLG